MRTIGLLSIGVLLLPAGVTTAQGPAESYQPVATMAQLMVDIIHPASNDILLVINRGGPKDDTEWAALRRNAMTLAESGNLLMMRGRVREGDWIKDAKLLVDVGTAAYKAGQAKDANTLAGLTERVDAACVTCHKQYRPNVHPRTP